MNDNQKAQAWASHLATKRSHRQARRNSFDAGWDAALAVFEKAHTPTTPPDDEREALRSDLVAVAKKAIGNEDYGPQAWHLMARDTEQWLWEHGFRSSEVPEPSAARECGFMGCGSPRCVEVCTPEMKCEPSDAVVEAFMRNFWSYAPPPGGESRVRAALRAAAEAGGQR